MFKTRIYHVNVNNVGYICLDTLNVPGKWAAGLTIRVLLRHLQWLLGHPNSGGLL